MASLLSPTIAMHRRELRADCPTIVLDLLAFDPHGTLRVLAQTREPESDIRSFDSHARLKNTALRATGESRCGIEGGTTCAGPEAQTHIAENCGNGAVQLRVNAEVRNDDASNENAKIFSEPRGK